MMQVTSEFALRALNNPRDPWERGVTSYGFLISSHESLSIRYSSIQDGRF